MVWPITAEQLRKQLKYKPGQDDPEELDLFAAAACELIDKLTGRDVDESRHLKPDGELPAVFELAARETAKLWWAQSNHGPRSGMNLDSDAIGPPMGAELPRKVQGWLAKYPARVGFGSDVRR